MTASLKEAFNEKWKANISKISNPSKDAQNILSAIKNSVLEFIPALIGELEEAKREILGLQEELREIKSNSPGPSTDSESDPKEIFSTRYACNAEVRRVQNTLIVEFREGHVLGKGKNLPGADFIKDINNEMAEIKDKQGKKPQDVKPGDLKWTKLSNPRTGAHAESTHYRLSMTRSYSKKALFAMLKHHGRTKYPTMSVRNETPGFLRSAKHCADHLASLIRTQTDRKTRTRVIFDAKRQAMSLQSATVVDGETKYVTHASSDPDPKMLEIAKMPSEVRRGLPEVEEILRKFEGYDPNFASQD